MRLAAKLRRGFGPRSGRGDMSSSGGAPKLAWQCVKRNASAIGEICNAPLSERDLAPDGSDQLIALRVVVGARGHRAPDRLRPGCIAPAAGDDMHMKLRHHIADRRD